MCEQQPLMLYMCAGMDIRPIQRYSHIFKSFIYVDERPSSDNGR